MVKELLKRVPGVRTFIGFLHAQRKFFAEIIARAYISRLNRYFWRAVHFDSLKAPLALSNHTRENYLVHTSDKIIGKLLYCRGDFDFQKFERAMYILNSDTKNRTLAIKPILYDIGANVGSIGIPAIKRGYVDHVIAFEPDPDNFRLLRINSILNSVDKKMECHQLALGAEPGTAILSKSKHNHGDHRVCTPTETSIISSAEDSSDSVTIEVQKLDDFLTNDTNFIVWIDVQGYEAHVLSGARNALRNTCPLILEFTPKDLIENGTMDSFLGQLTNSAYTRFFDLDKLSPVGIDLNKENILRLSRTLEKHDNFTDILFL